MNRFRAALRRGGDEGQATTMLAIPVAAGLVWLMMTLMIGLGDGTRSRTQSRTAADAAALAAVSAWQQEVGRQWLLVLADPTGHALTVLTTPPPVTLAGVQPELAARRFAAANDAVLESFRSLPTPDGVEYHVSVRSNEPAEQTGVTTRAEATAVVGLDSGLCWSAGGVRLGLDVAGVCTPVTVPVPLPPGVGPLRVVPRLVD